MTVAICLAIVLVLGLVGYAFFLTKKLTNIATDNAALDTTRIKRAEALEDKIIQTDQEDRNKHVKEADASALLSELSNKLHARTSK